MNLLKPPVIKLLAEQHGFKPSKQYGQHYLTSPKAVEAIMEAAEIHQKDTIIEIGPGFGVLTLPMAEKAEKIIAFEIERKLQTYWEERQEEYKNIEIIWGDAMVKVSSDKFQVSNYKVVANLPYQITSSVLRHFLEAEKKPERIVVMVQKEVAERISAKPGECSLLSVAVQYYGKPKLVVQIPRGSFWPQPKVDSAVISIIDIQPKRDLDEKFFEVVRTGFSAKRKQLAKNLSTGLSLDHKKVQEYLVEMGLSTTIRAQELSVREWLTLTKHIYAIPV